MSLQYDRIRLEIVGGLPAEVGFTRLSPQSPQWRQPQVSTATLIFSTTDPQVVVDALTTMVAEYWQGIDLRNVPLMVAAVTFPPDWLARLSVNTLQTDDATQKSLFFLFPPWQLLLQRTQVFLVLLPPEVERVLVQYLERLVFDLHATIDLKTVIVAPAETDDADRGINYDWGIGGYSDLSNQNLTEGDFPPADDPEWRFEP